MEINMQDGKRAICSNCKNRYTEGDKFCRYCGAPNGTPVYITDRYAMIYGPPYSAVHKCEKCGYEWKTSGLGRDKQNWCPRCGGEAPAKDIDEW